MHEPEVYQCLEGEKICLGHLDREEQKLLARIRRRAQANPDWDAFDNYWTHAVGDFYDARGLPRAASRKSALFRVAQDLSGRIAVTSGRARLDDYRGDLEDLIFERFPSRRAFCKAAGLSEDMLSHFLAGRKDLSLASLERALARLGYHLRIVPIPKVGAAENTAGKRGKRAARSA